MYLFNSTEEQSFPGINSYSIAGYSNLRQLIEQCLGHIEPEDTFEAYLNTFDYSEALFKANIVYFI